MVRSSKGQGNDRCALIIRQKVECVLGIRLCLQQPGDFGCPWVEADEIAKNTKVTVQS